MGSKSGGGAGEGESDGVIVKHIWTIAATDEEKFKETSARQIYNSLVTVFAKEDDDVFKTRSGQWIAKTKSGRDYSELNTIQIEGGGNIKVILKENIRGITCTGEIEHSSYIYCTEEELKDELKQKNKDILSIRKNKRWVQGQEVETGTVIITFNGRVRPKNVEIFGRSRETTEHIPKPKRCTKCQQFRHIRRFCSFANPVCARCTETHETKDCTATYRKCINCNGEHWASSWECPRYKREEEVEAIRERERLTYRQADYKQSKIDKPKVDTHTNVYATGVATSAGSGRQENVWRGGLPNGAAEVKVDELSSCIAELAKQIKMQSEVIRLQAEVLFKIVSKSIFLNTDIELRGDLKCLAMAYKNLDIDIDRREEEDDSDNMVFEEEKQDKNKRKLTNTNEEQEQASLQNQQQHMSKRQQKKLKKQYRRSETSREESTSRESRNSAKYYTKSSPPDTD
jgi:hypothetical protein